MSTAVGQGRTIAAFFAEGVMACGGQVGGRQAGHTLWPGIVQCRPCPDQHSQTSETGGHGTRPCCLGGAGDAAGAVPEDGVRGRAGRGRAVRGR